MQPPVTVVTCEARSRPGCVLCEDGTWQNSEGNISQGGNAPPSNVVRLARAIRPMSRDGIPQIVNYHVGVGATGGVVDKVYGGISGEGELFNLLSAVFKTCCKKRISKCISRCIT